MSIFYEIEFAKYILPYPKSQDIRKKALSHEDSAFLSG